MSLPIFPLKPDSDWTETQFKETFVLEIPRGRVLGPYGVVITPDNNLLEETGFEWRRSIKDHTVFNRSTMPEISYIDYSLAVIAAQAPANYYHWMLEIIPRIKTLKDSKVFFDKLYLPRLRYKFQWDSLNKLGFTESDILMADQDAYIEARHLVVPSLVNTLCPTNPPWAIQFLRDTFLPPEHNELPHDRRVYISRREVTTDWARRYIINENEVWGYLKEKGFEKVILEDLMIEEQAKLFNSAEIILGTHGAGLANLVFCRPGTKVFEFFNPGLLDEAYWFISDQIKLKHKCVLTSLNQLTPAQQASGDIFISMETLEEVCLK